MVLTNTKHYFFSFELLTIKQYLGENSSEVLVCQDNIGVKVYV